ncbi:MAG: flagellar biosynthesis protein FlhA [Polyangiaceae bacterium]
MSSAVASSKKGSANDLTVPIGVVGIIMMMVLPMPPFLVDVLLAVSMALAIGVFLIGLFMEKPLEFSAFPAVVLVATLLRLSVNIATTRLILLHGAEGQDAAGQVIMTFGNFVVGGNVVVGLVVFLILVVINFVVVTKGSGRVAEVAARFALDGMPGKQMAIDADLNAGQISPEQARMRRGELEREADFFGAMDGASKFVKGDAIAGLLITAINLVAGLALGVAAGMNIGDAARTFSILSVGDALVSQMPSLLMSTASGVVVTRSATGEQLGRALSGQLLGSRKAVAATGGMMAVMALVPGMPAVPFLAIAAALGWTAYQRGKKEEALELAPPPEVIEKPKSPTEELEEALPLDVLALEVGYELIHAVDPKSGGNLVDRISGLRKQLAMDLGVVIPPVHIRDNLQLEPSTYRMMLLGTELAKGNLRAGRLLALDPSGTAPPIDGEPTRDPAFGTPARWIPARERELAEALGYAVVDHTTVIATHLAETARTSAHQILGRAELQHLFDVFSKGNPKLVDDLVPNLLTFGEVLKVMRNLVKEQVSIRDLRTILEALIEISPSTRDTEQLTEMVRQRLSRQITAAHTDNEGHLATLVLDAQVEEMFRRSLQEIAAGTGGALDPELARRLGDQLAAAVQRMENTGRRPCVITSPDLRRYVRAFAERRCPQLGVLSFRELEPGAPIRPVETVSFNAAPRASA